MMQSIVFETQRLHSFAFAAIVHRCTMAFLFLSSLGGACCFAQNEAIVDEPKDDLPQVITNIYGMKLILIPAGKFSMGSLPDERNSKPDESIHKVVISKPFYIGTLEITEKQFAEVLEIQPRETPQKNANGRVVGKKIIEFTELPVLVTWLNATRFCEQLNINPAEKKEGRQYRLPSEAEWEYACRAGTQTAYHFGDDPIKLGEYAWFRGNSGSSKNKVFGGGQKKPNSWGLYDMLGNAQEWCLDLYSKDYPERLVTDPCLKPNGPVLNFSLMVARGGHVRSDFGQCRSASRNKLYADDLCGFRIVMIPKE